MRIRPLLAFAITSLGAAPFTRPLRVVGGRKGPMEEALPSGPTMPRKSAQARRKTKAKPAVNEPNSIKSDAKSAARKNDGRPARKRSRKGPQEPDAETSDAATPDTKELLEWSAASLSQRAHIMERNRIAATKCRTRKRSEATTLASAEREMEEQHRQLRACFESLRHERYILKTQLLQHTNCDCVLIQRYIVNEAKKSVDEMTSEIGDPIAPPGAPSVLTLMAHTSDMTNLCSTGDSLQTHSPLTSVGGEIKESPGPAVLGGQSSGGHFATHVMGEYQARRIAPYADDVAGSSMGVYTTTPSDHLGTTYAQPQQPQQHLELHYADDLGWSPGWATG